MAIVGIEPSEIYTLLDEYIDFFPTGDYAKMVRSLADRAFMIDEYLIRPGIDGKSRISHLAGQPGMEAATRVKKVLLHGHCYQKARLPSPDGYPTGLPATVKMLQASGYKVDVIETGCCGMAGAFGYEADHYAISMKVGEISLFPAIRSQGDEVILAASGVSCQAQIKDGCNRIVFHPVSLLVMTG
jgi:Fe-S oxidoreductase